MSRIPIIETRALDLTGLFPNNRRQNKLSELLIPNTGLGKFVLNALNGGETSLVIATVLWPAIGSANGLTWLRRTGQRWKFNS